MAKKGNFAALQQLRPLQGDISEDIKYWNEDRDAKRSQKTYEDELAYQKQEKERQQKRERYEKYVKPLNNYDTGSSSLNEFNARMITGAMKEYLPLIKTLESSTASDDEKIKAQIKLQNINNLPNNLKAVTEQYSAQWEAYQKAKKEGLAWEEPNMEKVFQDGFSSFKGGLDEFGMPIIAFIDKDGDGENDLLAVQGYDEIKSGMPLFDFQKKHNPEALAKSLADELGQSDITTQNGYSSERVKKVRDSDKETRVDTLLFGSDGNPTSVAKDALRRKGLDPTNPSEEDLISIKQDYLNLVGTFLPEIIEQDYDFSAQNAARKENRMARESSAEIAAFTEAVDPSEQTWGEKVKEISGKSVGISNVKVGAIKGKDGDITSNASIKNYSYKEDGTMLVDVEYPKTKSISKKEYEDIKSSAASGDQSAVQMLERMINTKSGERRITIPGTNDKKVIEVSPEDEASVAKAMGTTTSEMRKKAGLGEAKKPIYKGLDENGDPIFE